MITVKEKIRLIESCFGKAKLSNDNKNVVAFCPVCKSQGKDKFKLAIGIEKGMYHCWVCESKGRNIGRLALKYSNQKKAATELYSYFKTDKEDEQQLRLEEEKTVKLPEDFRLIATDRGHAAKLARAYLENRGFTKEDIWNFRVGISNQYGYKNRIIFPSFDSEQLIKLKKLQKCYMSIVYQLEYHSTVKKILVTCLKKKLIIIFQIQNLMIMFHV
jgi:DNA primase